MEREQARHDRELSRLIQERNDAGSRVVEARSNTNHQQSPPRTPDSLLEAVIELQRDVRRLQTQQPVLANREPLADPVIQSPARNCKENTDCYSIDEWRVCFLFLTIIRLTY